VTLVRKGTIPTEQPPHFGAVPTFADRGCRVVSATDPKVVNLDFLDPDNYFSIQIGPQLYARGSVDPISDPLLLRQSGNARNRPRDLWICSQEL
jgi:hypothetical protein